MSYVSQLSKESNNNNSSTVTFKTYNYMIIKYVSLSAKKLIYFNKHVLYIVQVYSVNREKINVQYIRNTRIFTKLNNVLNGIL